MKYITVHCLKALEQKSEFSAVHLNISIEKKDLVREVYPEDLYHLEFHSVKKNYKWVN